MERSRGLSSVGINVAPIDIKRAQKLIASATLESVRLLQVKAAHVGGNIEPLWPVKQDQPLKVLPEATEDNKRFAVTVRFAIQANQTKDAESAPIQIEALFQLSYAIPEGLNPSLKDLEAFSRTNALLNSWPYWREMVQSTVARMNLPPLTLPLFRIWSSPTLQRPPKARKSLTSKPKKT